jgi:RNA polymerase sigma-70 factor
MVDPGDARDDLIVAQFRRQVFEASRREWPRVELTFEEFSAHLNGLGYFARALPNGRDLYLSAGCALGRPAACRALETKYFAMLRRLLRNSMKEHDSVEEVLQQVRDRLLVGPPPKISRYRGDGPLGSWLRSVAINAARDHHRLRLIGIRDLATLRATLNPLTDATPSSPEDAAVQAQSSYRCEQALSAALHRLAEQDKRLLSLYFIAGLSIDQLGRIYAIDRSTAARRLNRILLRLRTAIHVLMGRTDACSGTLPYEMFAFSANQLFDSSPDARSPSRAVHNPEPTPATESVE